MSDLKLRYKQQEKLEDEITRLKKQLNAARDAKVSCREDIKNRAETRGQQGALSDKKDLQKIRRELRG